MLGPPVLFPVYGWSVALARPGCGDHQTVHDADADVGDKPANHPMWAFGPDLSANPMAYLCVYILIIFFVKCQMIVPMPQMQMVLTMMVPSIQILMNFQHSIDLIQF